jgi:hypothetical protein
LRGEAAGGIQQAWDSPRWAIVRDSENQTGECLQIRNRENSLALLELPAISGQFERQKDTASNERTDGDEQ